VTTADQPRTAASEPIWFIDNLARVLVDGAASDGALAIVELAGREGDMPPLHVHHREDETFVVLEGSLALFLPEGRRIDLGAGEAAVAPRDTPHVYRVESEQARWLAIGTPAGFDAFVREAGEPAGSTTLPPEREHDPARLSEIAAAYGIEVLGPPGTLPV
jgi:mannose-6-phosphate isomerase-like protein (cupin superfamily)